MSKMALMRPQNALNSALISVINQERDHKCSQEGKLCGLTLEWSWWCHDGASTYVCVDAIVANNTDNNSNSNSNKPFQIGINQMIVPIL